MRRAIARLGGHDHVLVDGLRIADFEAQVGPYTAIVDGDARVYSIACASVVAKVVRDRMMRPTSPCATRSTARLCIIRSRTTFATTEAQAIE